MGKHQYRPFLAQLRFTVVVTLCLGSISCQPLMDAMCDLFSEDPECGYSEYDTGLYGFETSQGDSDADSDSDSDSDTDSDDGIEWFEDCGNIPYEGCCDGDTLYYCDGSYLATVHCPTWEAGTSCGWYAEDGYEFYNCVAESVAAAEPTGAHPMECPDR